MSPSIRVGTAGWSYPHWNGLVYPKAHAPGFHPLELIAKQLDCVEINSSFYQPLKPEVVKLWMKKVEAYPDFTFTAKLHQDFTHKRVLDQAGIAQFKEGLWPLLRAKKLGALLMQFPWSFRFTAENREFFIDLRRAFHEFPLVAEMRHSSWMAEEAIGTFLDYRVGFCNIDQPQYTRAMPPTAILTSEVGYVRLHGRNPQNSLGAFEPVGPAEAAARLSVLAGGTGGMGAAHRADQPVRRTHIRGVQQRCRGKEFRERATDACVDSGRTWKRPERPAAPLPGGAGAFRAPVRRAAIFIYSCVSRTAALYSRWPIRSGR